MSTINKCDRCGKEMNSIYTRFTVDCLRGHLERDNHILDLCEKCNEEFEKFMKPTKDKSSAVKLRPWSEVGEPPKINGYQLEVDEKDTGCEQCEFDSTSIDEEPCAICGGTSNFKPKGFYYACEQCKFKDFSWDEEPCSTCKHSVMSIDEDSSDNFEPKKEETDADDALSKAKYKVGSYIRSYINGDFGNLYKIVDIRLRCDGEIVYTVKSLKTNGNSILPEIAIDNWCTLIVKYSCDGCKLEGTDDCMCDTCIVGDPKDPRRQWWEPKEEEE